MNLFLLKSKNLWHNINMSIEQFINYASHHSLFFLIYLIIIPIFSLLLRVIRKSVTFNEIPGFKKLYGLMLLPE